MVSSRAERGIRRTMGRKGTARQALVSRADDRLRVGRPAREGEEAAVHLEGRARARAAIGRGRFETDRRVVEFQVLAVEELGEALGDQLVAQPLGPTWYR